MRANEWSEVGKRLEPDASAGEGDTEALLISIAISLKRIADNIAICTDVTERKDGSQIYGEIRVSDCRA